MKQKIARFSCLFRQILCYSFLLLFAKTVIAQVQKQTPVYTSLSALIGGYYESLPVDYSSNPTKKYPLLVFIHGKGELGDGSASQLPRVMSNGPARLINQGKFPSTFKVNGDNYSFIVISPQFSTDKYSSSPAAINDVINYCIQKYRVDEERIYITGLSMGGGFAWRVISTYPERIAAGLMVCGATNYTQERVDKIVEANLPVWATHNSGDGTVPVSVTQNWINKINTHLPAPNPAAKMTIFNVNSHDAWSKTYDPNYRENGMNVYEWMLSHKRGAPTATPPIADAGSNQIISLPANSVTLDGTKSTAPGGSISSYLWTKLSGPSTGNITSPAGSKTTVTNLTEGSYQFQLKITDNKGVTAIGVVTVKVNPAPLPPIADAGNMQIITLPVNTILLDGTKSVAPSGNITTYQWIKKSGPSSGTIVNPGSSTTQVTGLSEGDYVFQLKITDNNGGTANATVSITVNAAPVPPIADAGNDQTIELPNNSIILDGSNSLAPSGNMVSYKWTKLSGPSGENIVASSNVSTEVKGLKKGTYQFELKVTDNNGLSATSSVSVIVNAAPLPPVADAGQDQTVILPVDFITLDGSASIAPGDLISSYQWYKTEGPAGESITDADEAITSVTGLKEGVYKFELEVTNSKGLSSSSIIVITVKAAPLPPVANAGITKTIVLPANSVTLDGSLSEAKSGSIAEYSWYKLTGPLGETIATPNQVLTFVSNLTEGEYAFELKVTDGNGLSSTASVAIIVKPAPVPPVADAGENISITLPMNNILLDGTGSSAPSGTITGYVWSQLSGPSGSVILSPGNAKTNVTGLTEGIYVFELQVTDDNGLSSTSSISVTVKAAPLPPVAYAGSPQTITLPDDMVTLDGSNSFASSGIINQYLWSKLSGPTGVVIGSVNDASTNITGLSEGVYIFGLKVTDNIGLSSDASVEITVKPALLPPVADAGMDITLVLPEDSVTLNGSSSIAPSGSITDYEWSKISGPDDENIIMPQNAVTVVKGLHEGVYQFKLKVTDDNGLSSENVITVTVNQEALPPVANAGTEQVIVLPVNEIFLDGSASVAQTGSINSYNWLKLSGPANEVISTPDEKITRVSNLLEGVYKFQLTVTDENGGSSTASVSIIVKASPLPPIANAGISQTVELPNNSVILDGSGSSAVAGNIVGFHWRKISGPESGEILSSDDTITVVNNLSEGVYEFELKVEDNNGNSSSATVVIIVKPALLPPVADAGEGRSITLPINTTVLDGSGSTAPSGVINSYKWKKISGPVNVVIESPENAIVNVNELSEGEYVFELTVTDNHGNSSAASVAVKVNAAPLPPVADAGGDQLITLPINSITLDGSASEAMSGTLKTYEWTKVSGPAGEVIESAGSVQTMVTNLSQGNYTFKLSVEDSNGGISTAFVSVSVNPAPLPPISDAGNPQTVTLPVDSVKLDGSSSVSQSGTILSYSWSKVTGPSGIGITSFDSVTTVVKNLSKGIYIFELKVTDENGISATSTVVITVKETPPPPVADAGSAQTLTLPDNTITLNGSGSFSSEYNTITSYHWSKVAGPSEGIISDENAKITVVTGLTAGIYLFQLEVNDDKGEKSTAVVTITVESAPPPPVAVAGNDQTIRLPVNRVNLDGSKSSAPGGMITKYEWSKVSGPSGGDFVNPMQPASEVNDLREGKYQFRLQVTDNTGATSSATVFVTVKPAPLPPVANAGSAQTITLPVNVVTLDGTKSIASEGTIKTYSWSKVSGTSAGNIKKTSGATTLDENLEAGTYVFKLKVTDSNGNSSTASVTVVVKPAPIVPPIANAGDDLSIQLPVDKIHLDGNLSYALKGKIEKYRWEKVSGPGNLYILNSNSANPTIENTKAGEYVFKLTVEDSNGFTSSDLITITVVDEAVVLPPPVANAGENKTISLADNETYLDGGNSYAQFGVIEKYSWKLVSGPSNVIIENAEQDLALVSGFVSGEYEFMLTVTDNTGKIDQSIVKINVVSAGTRRDLSPLIKIFPNPVQDAAVLELQGPAKGRTSINIYDTNGRRIFQREFIKDDIYVNQQIDLRGLVKGVYFMEVIVDYQYKSLMKIIKL